jgi:hypothetical protein
MCWPMVTLRSPIARPSDGEADQRQQFVPAFTEPGDGVLHMSSYLLCLLPKSAALPA